MHGQEHHCHFTFGVQLSGLLVSGSKSGTETNIWPWHTWAGASGVRCVEAHSRAGRPSTKDMCKGSQYLLSCEKEKKTTTHGQYGNLWATDLIIMIIFHSRFTSCISTFMSMMIYRQKQPAEKPQHLLNNQREGKKPHSDLFIQSPQRQEKKRC